MLTLALPTEYSYVLATIFASTVLNQYHGLLVGGERKAANVPYPAAYASQAETDVDVKKYRFNCAQRAHANYLENLPTFVITSTIAGLQYPVATAALGAVWLVGRLVYTKGYISSTPEQKGNGRYKGVFYAIGHLGLLGLAGYSVYGLIMN